MQLLMLLLPGAVWLAYFHPSAWSKISSALGKLMLAWMLAAVGFRFGFVYASMCATELHASSSVIEALDKFELPLWATVGPGVLMGFVIGLETLPLFGLTDLDRRREIGKKLGAARRPPPMSHEYWRG